MALKRGIATVCLSGPIEDKLDACARAGFDGVELFENDLVVSDIPPIELRAMAADLGLTVELYQPFRDAEGVPKDRWPQVVKRFQRKLGVMDELGVDTILVCSSVAADTIDDDDLVAEQLAALAAIAHDRGKSIAYEALAWGANISTWRHSWDVVRKADSPALGLCLDSFHILARDRSPLDLEGVAAEKIFFVQLADAPLSTLDPLQWSRHLRVFPGQGVFDLAQFVDALLDAGYNGLLSLEVFNDVYRQADPFPAAVDAMRSLILLESEVATKAEHSRTRSGVEGIPDAPPLEGFSFVELFVDGVSGPKIEDVLRLIGFRHSGQHRSKPVQLWSQGSAHLALNAGPARAPTEPGIVEVGGIGVVSSDLQASVERGRWLRAERVEHRRGRDEYALESFRSPDRSEVTFCAPGAQGEASWADDFIPIETSSADEVGLTAIDHVALPQPFDRFDGARLYFESLLGLPREPLGELAASYGLIRTSSTTDSKRTVRIALSVTLLRRGEWGSASPEPQHVAFACRDVVSTARVLRARNAPVLEISDNYYADLASRVPLSDETLNTWSSLNLLYDCDDTGEFLHLYTELVGHRVFFELVQRFGDYDGYAAVNAPVRMAAHRRLSAPTDPSVTS